MYKPHFILLSLAMLTACTSDKTLEEVVDISLPDSPMRFSTQREAEQNVTRALLRQGFQVSCWKNYPTATMQTVMDEYEVVYTTGETRNWSYEDVEGQYLKYWDLSAYPYEFRAVTPYLHKGIIDNTATGLSIDLTSGESQFRAQTFLDDVYNQDVTASEPCLVAQVSRSRDHLSQYIDRDCLADQLINTATQYNPVREVNLPFHHLMSKVGFRLYIDDPTVPSYDIRLSNVSISIFNAKDNFQLVSQQYDASTSGAGLLHGTFSHLTLTTTDEQPLITHQRAYSDVNMKDHLYKSSAFDFRCPDDLLQIPQRDLLIHVRLSLSYNLNGEDKQFDYDSLLRLDPEDPASEPQRFDWDPNCHYIYYLHLKNLELYPIVVCTAQLVPWEVVHTSDIPIGL